MATNNFVNVALSGYTGNGNFVGADSPSLVTPTMVGISSNTQAAPGYVGEYINSQVTAGSPVTLLLTTPGNVTSISLTAGNWDVFANINITDSTNLTVCSAGISTTSATLPDASLQAAFAATACTNFATAVPSQPLFLSVTTTVYLVAEATFTGSCTACGFLWARRRI